MQSILEHLYNGLTLNNVQSRKFFFSIMKKKLNTVQIASALISMKIRGECFEEIFGAASAILTTVKPFSRPNYLFADISGTGGDKKNTMNISTISAFVAASCGVAIAKHGNKSISSPSGSADLLEELGVKLDMSALESRQALDEIGICFLFAPKYYINFNNVMEIRKILNTTTIFHILGPLINPARPPIALIGVYHDRLLLPIAETLKKLGYQRAAVVHSDGTDEVTLHAPTHVAELKNGKIETYFLTPIDFGLSFQKENNLFLSVKEKKIETMIQLLKGHGEKSHNDVIAANVSLLLKLFGHEDLRKNVNMALNSIYHGLPYKKLLSLKIRGK